MDFLIREISQEQGQIVYQDTEVTSELISIGSAPDQLIQLLGGALAREHAVLKMTSGQLSVAGVNKNTINLNGVPVKNANLVVGDELELATHQIKIVRPPAGFDAACELTIDEKLQEQALESAYVTRLEDTVLGKRTPSYILSLLVVISVLVWPLWSYLTRDTSVIDTLQTDSTLSMAERLHLRAEAGGGDILWSSGPLLPAHQLEIGDDCSACHKVAFEKVQDSACMDCHGEVAEHFDDSVHPHLSLGVTQCQSCHKEHNEPETMVVSADGLCVGCHDQAMITQADDKMNIEAVIGFDGTEHPEFKLDFLLPSVVKKGTGLSIDWYHQLIQRPTKQGEVSNLKFPHDVHLDAEKVQTMADDRPMLCSDCHALKSDNEHFEDITMERHCSQCHDLSFDVADPDRQLPHGDPRFVIQTIEEHFVRVYTDPNFESLGKQRLRRRPGQTRSGEVCSDTSFNCAIAKATKEAGRQFTQRGCITCHEVSDNQSSDLYARWMVLPVKINHNWYARAHFDHLSHLTQHGESENQVCSSCHKAATSAVSADVLIPGIENCLSCHGDHSVDEKVTVNCISCHSFHLDKQKNLVLAN